MKHNSIVVFFVLLVSLSGLAVIASFPSDVTGDVSFIESILNWLKPATENYQKSQTNKILIEPEVEKYKEEIKQSILDPIVIGTWRPHYQGIFYDAGASNYIKKPVTRKLTISADGTWEFGSTGTWEVKPITDEDWERWGIQPYGATKKIILYNWNENTAEGPIDEGTAGVDFIWVIYRSDKLSLGPATIQIKFGH